MAIVGVAACSGGPAAPETRYTPGERIGDTGQPPPVVLPDNYSSLLRYYAVFSQCESRTVSDAEHRLGPYELLPQDAEVAPGYFFVSTWVRASTILDGPRGERPLVAMGDADVGAGAWRLYLTGNRSETIVFEEGDNELRHSVSSWEGFAHDWVHIALTYAHDVLTLHLDGARVAEVARPGLGVPFDGTEPLTIGWWQSRDGTARYSGVQVARTMLAELPDDDRVSPDFLVEHFDAHPRDLRFPGGRPRPVPEDAPSGRLDRYLYRDRHLHAFVDHPGELNPVVVVAQPDRSPYSISFWFRVEFPSDDPIQLVNQGNRDPGAPGWSFLLGTSGNLTFRTSSELGAAAIKKRVADTNWHHVLGVIDRSGDVGRLRLYVDGEAATSGGWGNGAIADETFPVEAPIATGEPLRVAHQLGSDDTILRSRVRVDDVRVYRELLGAEDATHLTHDEGLDFRESVVFDSRLDRCRRNEDPSCSLICADDAPAECETIYCYRTPTIVTSGSGAAEERLFAFAQRRGGFVDKGEKCDDWGDVEWVLQTSIDGGIHWQWALGDTDDDPTRMPSELRTLAPDRYVKVAGVAAPHPAPDRVQTFYVEVGNDPELGRTDTNHPRDSKAPVDVRIWARTVGIDGQQLSLGRLVDLSGAFAANFAGEVIAPVFGPGHAIVLEEGPWAGYWAVPVRVVADDVETRSRVMFVNADASGDADPDSVWFSEPLEGFVTTESQVVEIEGGDLFMTARTEQRTTDRIRMGWLFGPDEGVPWSPLGQAEVPHFGPKVAPTVNRLRPGVLLFANTAFDRPDSELFPPGGELAPQHRLCPTLEPNLPNRATRRHLTVQLSDPGGEPEGRTWNVEKLVRAGAASYVDSAVFGREPRIGLLYEGGESQGDAADQCEQDSVVQGLPWYKFDTITFAAFTEDWVRRPDAQPYYHADHRVGTIEERSLDGWCGARHVYFE